MKPHTAKEMGIPEEHRELYEALRDAVTVPGDDPSHAAVVAALRCRYVTRELEECNKV